MTNLCSSEMGFRLHEPSSREATRDPSSQEAGHYYEAACSWPDARRARYGPVSERKATETNEDTCPPNAYLLSGFRVLDHLLLTCLQSRD